MCYGRTFLHAKLYPSLNTISNNCVRENSLQLNSKEVLYNGRPLLLAKLHPSLNTIPNNCVRETSLSSIVKKICVTGDHFFLLSFAPV